jgi:hypothetical protein
MPTYFATSRSTAQSFSADLVSFAALTVGGEPEASLAFLFNDRNGIPLRLLGNERLTRRYQDQARGLNSPLYCLERSYKPLMKRDHENLGSGRPLLILRPERL